MSRRIAPFAGALAAWYLVLAVSAAVCALEHGARSQSNHHQQTGVHSALCAWACQANPAHTLLPSAPPMWLWLAAFVLPLADASPVIRLLELFVRSRAPPR